LGIEKPNLANTIFFSHIFYSSTTPNKDFISVVVCKVTKNIVPKSNFLEIIEALLEEKKII
jgi:hypothetical protein